MEDTIKAFPEFKYIDTMSYQDNYYRWKDMNDAEQKWYGDKCLSGQEAEGIFRKQWGYKYTQKTIPTITFESHERRFIK